MKLSVVFAVTFRRVSLRCGAYLNTVGSLPFPTVFCVNVGVERPRVAVSESATSTVAMPIGIGFTVNSVLVALA